ncbi:hypothetical protein NMY22_g12187 [Coprinellus aureogranulatus]|nr:hypothetical protein NMY22_g12187 [Coprinellus aureogranulatus]
MKLSLTLGFLAFFALQAVAAPTEAPATDPPAEGEIYRCAGANKLQEDKRDGGLRYGLNTKRDGFMDGAYELTLALPGQVKRYKWSAIASSIPQQTHSKMRTFLMIAALLVSALGVAAAPAADGTPCSGPGEPGARCPTGQTCCFSSSPEFPNGMYGSRLSPVQDHFL